MEPTPKLKAAMAEISAIMDKYDIGGNVTLHYPGEGGEFLLKIDPSYSCAKINAEKDGIAFNGSSKHYNGDKEAAYKAQDATINMMCIMRDIAANVFMQMNQTIEQLKTVMDIEEFLTVSKESKEVDESEPKDFHFIVISKMALTHEKGQSSSILKFADLRLEVSKNMDAGVYIDENDLPTKEALKPISNTLVLGLITNMRNGAIKGWWKESEHMQYVIDKLQEAFVTVTSDPINSTMDRSS
jgi:hypothetical protein